mgnify:CR=1 FL=1
MICQKKKSVFVFCYSIGIYALLWMAQPAVSAKQVLTSTSLSSLSAGHSLHLQPGVVTNTIPAVAADTLTLYGTVFLMGCYNPVTDEMEQHLVNQRLLPQTDPYGLNTIPHRSANNRSVVDWIKIELRDKNDPDILVSERAAFLSPSGALLDTNYNQGVRFTGLADDVFFIRISHRNHLAVRTPIPVAFSRGVAHYNFSSGQKQVFNHAGVTSNGPMKELRPGRWGLWAGNANGDQLIRYTGPQNDENILVNTCLTGNISSVIQPVYSNCDFNMNGVVRYNGPQNDEVILLSRVLEGNNSAIYQEHR